MAVRVSTDNDWQLLERPETVTLFCKTQEKPPPTGQDVPNCEFFNVKKDKLAGDALLAKIDISVRMWASQMSGAVPKMWDQLLRKKDGSKWIIMIVEPVAWESEYRLHLQRSPKS